jgi:hypothetical protein
MDQGVEMVQQVVMSKSNGRWEGKSEECWDSMSTVTPSFIWATCDSVTIRFPRKMCLSVSTTYTIRMWDQGAKKLGSSKDFEVCGILKKEPRSNGPNSYEANQHGYMPEVKKRNPSIVA